LQNRQKSDISAAEPQCQQWFSSIRR